MTLEWWLELGAKAAAPIAVSALLGALGWGWRTGRKVVKAIIFITDIQQANADQLRKIAEAADVDHHRTDILTDALEDARYPRRGLVPPERQRRKDGTLCDQDREGVEAVRAMRALIRAGKPPEEP